MSHKVPLVLTAKNIPGLLQSADTLRLIPRAGLFSAMGSASDYPADLYISTDSQETYWSDGSSWVKVGRGITNFVSSVDISSTDLSVSGNPITTSGTIILNLAAMPTKTIKGNDTGGSAVPTNLTTANLAAMFGTPTGTKFLADDGTLKNPTDTAQIKVDDGASVAGNTGLMLWDVDNNTLERVTVGAADSGGTGFKLLRIPN